MIILFEGWGAAGKGTLISDMLQNLDPRSFKVLLTGEDVPRGGRSMGGLQHGVEDRAVAIVLFVPLARPAQGWACDHF